MNKNGKFLKKLGNRGQGPNEYLYISHIFTDDDIIYLSDRVADRPNFLMKYDFNGNLIGKISKPQGGNERYVFQAIQPLKRDTFVMDVATDNNEKYPKALLVETNESESFVIHEYPNYFHLNKGEVRGIMPWEQAILYRYKNEIRFFKQIYCDTIFTIGHDLELRDGF